MSITKRAVESQPVAAVRSVSLRNLVYDSVLQAIFAKQLRPGDHLREHEMSQMLEVSRTPMREALTLLERDGFVQYFHNRGWFVAKYEPDEILEIFTLRSGLENLATDLIIDRLGEEELGVLARLIEELGQPEVQRNESLRFNADRKFHETIVKMAGNTRLHRMWERVYAQCAIVFNYHTVTIPDYDHWQGVVDHTMILDALRSGDIVKVHAANNAINRRVAEQCIAGYLAVEGDAGPRRNIA